MKDLFSKRNITIIVILFLIILSTGCSKEEKLYGTVYDMESGEFILLGDLEDIDISSLSNPESGSFVFNDEKVSFSAEIISSNEKDNIIYNTYEGTANIEGEEFHISISGSEKGLSGMIYTEKTKEVKFGFVISDENTDDIINEMKSTMEKIKEMDSLPGQKEEQKNEEKVDKTKNPEVINGLPGENVREGDIYVFGEYKGSLRWEVLNVNDGKALLIAEKAIEDIPNNNPEEWLKKSFYFEAFSIDYRYARIDKDVFLLDENQKLEYFSNHEVGEIMKRPALWIDLNENLNWDDSLSWDHQLEFFMYYLMDKDIENIFDLIGLRASHLERFENGDGKEQDVYEAYGFLKDVKIKGYQVLSSEERQYDGRRYIVELDIEESQTPYFTKGKSNWQVEFGIDGSSPLQLFKPQEVQINPIQFSETSHSVNFAYKAAVYLELFEDIDDFNVIVPGTDVKEFYFDQFTLNMMRLLYNRFENMFITAEGLKTEVEKAFGITDVEFTRYYRYDPETDSMSFGAGGGMWMFTDLVSEEFDKETDTYTITIDFYADAAYLLKAKTMKYKVVKTEEDEYRMISSECLYDSGYIPFRDGI